ncbi:MAG: single-stranded DNA-binding protein [Potamolinea sp.]
MNTCILMAQIIQDPELRYTSDNQTPIAQMLVQFPGQRAEEQPTTLKVVGWGNFAQEIKQKYSAGDRVVIEGRLGMINLDRPEGFKEKRAELTASRIYKLGADTDFTQHLATPNSGYETSAPSAAPSGVPSGVTSGVTSSAPSSKSNVNVVPLRPPVKTTPMSPPVTVEREYASPTTGSTFEPTIVPSSTHGNPQNEQDLDDIPF